MNFFYCPNLPEILNYYFNFSVKHILNHIDIKVNMAKLTKKEGQQMALIKTPDGGFYLDDSQFAVTPRW